MLVVGDRVNEESQINASALNIDDFIWPHGVTPPLKHVRKRRFRKRVSRRAIEVVEEQVEELLGQDEGADDIQTGKPLADVPLQRKLALTH
jgi:transcription initiation factor TFIID subunit 7